MRWTVDLVGSRLVISGLLFTTICVDFVAVPPRPSLTVTSIVQVFEPLGAVHVIELPVLEILPHFSCIQLGQPVVPEQVSHIYERVSPSGSLAVHVKVTEPLGATIVGLGSKLEIVGLLLAAIFMCFVAVPPCPSLTVTRIQ